MTVEVDEKKLSQLESNALALQTIAKMVLADVSEIRKNKNTSAKRPKKRQTDWNAVIMENILTRKYVVGGKKK